MAAFTSNTTSTLTPAKGRIIAGLRMPSDSPCRIPPRVLASSAYRVGTVLPRTIAAMKIINLLHVVVAQAFYRWAMREINPMHPDVPRIMLRQQQLAEKYRRIWA